MNDRAQILITAIDQTKSALASVKGNLESLSVALRRRLPGLHRRAQFRQVARRAQIGASSHGIPKVMTVWQNAGVR